MTTKAELAEKISIIEKDLNLYDIKIMGVSFWRILRLPILRQYSLREHGVGKTDARTKKKSINKLSKKALFSNIFSSFKNLLDALFFSRKTVDTVVMAFPRLQHFEGAYMDKFTDPLIELTEINKNYLIFQRHHGGSHYQNRRHSENTITTDSIDTLCKVLAVLVLPIMTIIYLVPVIRLFLRVKNEFSLGVKSLLSFFLKVSEFFVSHKIYAYVLKRLGVKQVFMVNRQVFYPVTFACKKLGVQTFELQHGVTYGWTLLYSGLYDEKLDVDRFLTFGPHWKGKQFGLPVEKIEDIGWAYKSVLMDSLKTESETDSVLIISDALLVMRPVIEMLSKRYPEREFHIRPHPNEYISSELKEGILLLPNAKMLDNSEDSIAVLSAYRVVVSVSSSVLFEALAMGKIVGVINIGDCKTTLPEKTFGNAFCFLSVLEDFDRLFSIKKKSGLDSRQYYGDFSVEKFNGMLL